MNQMEWVGFNTKPISYMLDAVNAYPPVLKDIAGNDNSR
jgi:hypothetical protein